MPQISFHFTALAHSFKVHVSNLALLSVEQIQEIESFVQKRNGVFDFNTYSFSLQKKIEFNEFVKLINNSSIEAICINEPLISKVQARISFGQYKGMYYNELPDSYLIWLKGNYSGLQRETIMGELQKRGL